MMINHSTAWILQVVRLHEPVHPARPWPAGAPGNVATQLLRGREGRWESVFHLLCRKIYCHFPENPQCGEVVHHPRLKLQIQRMLKELHDRVVILLSQV
jgi:hypothetical protein